MAGLTPPPLPPRSPSAARPGIDADPRSSSTASLVPSASSSKQRTLLLIYIHGFMGNETSFQSFPAHLHNLLTVTLDNLGYDVHTKVYPKFKTRDHISVATENFSRWLQRFVADDIDTVLLGHSMGGILASEVILLGRHRILGQVAFDTPFLGMHPGVISAGLASIFRPSTPPLGAAQQAEENPTASKSSLEITGISSTVDEFFATVPPQNLFTSSALEQKKEPMWTSTLNFIAKHHGHLTQATGRYLVSHLEFNSCLTDPWGLKNRHNCIRTLEDERKVRFANYYTASDGRSKDRQVPSAPVKESFSVNSRSDIEGRGESEELSRTSSLTLVETLSRANTYTNGCEGLKEEPGSKDKGLLAFGNTLAEEISKYAQPTNKASDFAPPLPASSPPSSSTDKFIPPIAITTPTGFPPLPDPPREPSFYNYSSITDKSLRKAAETEAKRLQKEYSRALKEHEKLAKAREKALQRIETGKVKAELKEHVRQEKEAQRLARESVRMAQASAELEKEQNTEFTTIGNSYETLRDKPLKKRREHRFCIIPSPPDPCWVKVEMKGIDEVGAHCGLFFVGDVYERLVGDVAAKIEQWVGEDRTRALLAEVEYGGQCETGIIENSESGWGGGGLD